jgi:hypothetical protein
MHVVPWLHSENFKFEMIYNKTNFTIAVYARTRDQTTRSLRSLGFASWAADLNLSIGSDNTV